MSLAALPGGIRDIAEVIGLAGAIQLMHTLGGLELPIPKGTDSRIYDLLVDVVGTESADRLVAHYGDTRLNIPKGAAAARAARDARMRAAYDQGQSVEALVMEYHLTSRRVREILNAPVVAVYEQMGLF